MLREVPSEILSDKHRRWFQDALLDLIVWLSADDAVIGFQLCYRVFHLEHALTWTAARGFSHDRVDTGENWPGQNDTPILIADGPFPKDEVAARFAAESRDVDLAIRALVLEKLATYVGVGSD